MSESEAAPKVRVVDRRWWARDNGADDAGVPASTKPTYVEELERRLGDMTTQLQEQIGQHRRSLDEFEQVKLRIRRDVAREVERGKRTLLVDLLEVLDNLDRAVTAAREGSRPEEGEPSTSPPRQADQGGAVEKLVRGVELVRSQFLARLESVGVRRVPALGQLFDPQRHEAVTTTPVANPTDDGLVVSVIREGYAMGDEVLRPASVVVGRLEK